MEFSSAGATFEFNAESVSETSYESESELIALLATWNRPRYLCSRPKAECANGGDALARRYEKWQMQKAVKREKVRNKERMTRKDSTDDAI